MSERSLCKLCARAGLAGVCCFTAAVLIMHLVQPELSPLNDAVSYYMNGRFGWMLAFGLIATGAGSLALVWALGRFLALAKVRVDCGV